MKGETILEASSIWRIFQGTEGPIEVLRGLNLKVVEGEIVVILGASGAGKSTLLHILGTLDMPDRGKVMVKGLDPRNCSSAQLDRIRNSYIGFVFQFHYLLPEFTAIENVMMPALIGGRRGDLEAKARKLLEDVGLEERIYHRPAELSGGEQQRVAVARALVNDPAIVLADEPSGNLDDETSDGLHSLFRELCDTQGRTFVLVTHKKELMEKADRGFLLEKGVLHQIRGKDALPIL